MSTAPKRSQSPSARRVAAYRQRMRGAGLVPKTIWVPDMKDPPFLARLDRECRLIAAAEGARASDDAEATALMEGLYAELDLGPIPAYRLPDK
jgi:hypothetical protein